MPYFPSRKPYQTGYFPVSDSHRIYYACYGNPRGIPVLFVHGGPGAGCSKNAHRYFDPKRFNILTVDQRGCGKSKPFASLKGNTTHKLVEDFRMLLQHLGVKKTFLFGGSWGSCLSLCYAIKYPQTVLGMVLRGIFLGTGAEMDYLLQGGPQTHFPEVWKRFISLVPPRERNHPVRYYWKKINSTNPKTSYRYCREWSIYESMLLSLDFNPKKVLAQNRGKRVVSLARVEGHYFLNNCFLPPRYILNNAKKINRIPLTIVHGRYDFVCIPQEAYRLHASLPESKLFFVTSGHTANDAIMRETLIREFKKLTWSFPLSQASTYYDRQS